MAQSTSAQAGKASAAYGTVSHLCVVIFHEILRTRALTIGAAVAFFLLMSLVPLLLVASALLSALPVPNLFQQLLDMMSLLAPPDAMSFVKTLIASILTAHPARILSIGLLSYVWTASGSFSALIEALNIAYDVKIERPWWRDRVQALLLTFVCGGLAVVSLLLVLAGPPVIHFLSNILPISAVFTRMWPPVRLLLMFACFVANVMLLYYFGPNRRVHFRGLLPGATLAVAIWFLGSLGLDVYIGHFSNYNATYGSLGAIIILMLWLYMSSVSILVGAELNAELWKQRHSLDLRSQALKAAVAAPGPSQPAHVGRAVHSSDVA